MKRLFAGLFSLTLFAVFALSTPVASAAVDVFQQACNGQTTGADGATKDDPNVKKATNGSAACSVSGANPVTGSDGILAKVSRLIAYIAGISAIIIIIVGGVMYVTSEGDPSKTAAARNTVIYAAIGLVVVVMAQGIIVFILNKV